MAISLGLGLGSVFLMAGGGQGGMGTPADVTWGDGTDATWGDGTKIEWSSAT